MKTTHTDSKPKQALTPRALAQDISLCEVESDDPE